MKHLPLILTVIVAALFLFFGVQKFIAHDFSAR